MHTAILLFGMTTETTAEGTIEYFDATGIGIVVLVGVALFFILRNERRNLRERVRKQGKRPPVESPADLDEKLAALSEATEKMNKRLHR